MDALTKLEMVMNLKIKISLMSIILVFQSSVLMAQDEEVIMAKDAIHHDGEMIQVCGIIAETNYVRGDKGSPTYLNFTNPYPRHNFTVIVWKEDRKHFDYKPESLEGYQACVYGEIFVRRSRPQMTIRLPDQISARPVPQAPTK
jgi:hypothetical protein